jgi:hypothetical protein
MGSWLDYLRMLLGRKASVAAPVATGGVIRRVGLTGRVAGVANLSGAPGVTRTLVGSLESAVLTDETAALTDETGAPLTEGQTGDRVETVGGG